MLYQKLSDKDLLELLRIDDENAFTEIYERYHSLLYIYANKKLSNSTEAKDIVQDVLMVIWNRRSSLTLSGSLRSYLFTAIRNKILDIFSHQKVEERYLDSLQNIMLSSTASDMLIREKELSILIEREIDLMPPRMKEIFRLSRKEWLSNSEISQKLELSQHTVETQMKRALRHLRLRLSHFSQFFFFL